MTDISYLPFYQWLNNRSRCSYWSRWNTLAKHFLNLSFLYQWCIVLLYFPGPKLWNKFTIHQLRINHQCLYLRYCKLLILHLEENEFSSSKEIVYLSFYVQCLAHCLFVNHDRNNNFNNFYYLLMEFKKEKHCRSNTIIQTHLSICLKSLQMLLNRLIWEHLQYIFTIFFF